MNALRLLTGLFVVAMGSAASAQNYAAYGTYHHASTAEEGMARGMADIVRAAGQRNLKNSEAAQNYQQARYQQLNNRLTTTQVYMERRRLAKQWRDENRRPRPTSEQLFRINEAKRPRPLSPSDVDAVTGEIAWPPALQQSQFAEERASLEEIFKSRAQKKGVASDEFFEVQRVGKSMQDKLKTQLKQLPPSDYIRAKSFLTSLMYEVRRA